MKITLLTLQYFSSQKNIISLPLNTKKVSKLIVNPKNSKKREIHIIIIAFIFLIFIKQTKTGVMSIFFILWED